VTGTPHSAWLPALRLYLGVLAGGHLVWEILQLPLYTIWTEQGLARQAFAVAHCTLGDLLIALSSLVLALVLAGSPAWPRGRFGMVAGLTIIFGVAYTIFSEWLNTAVRASWAYSPLMPVVSLFGVTIGLSPVLQWLLVPAAAFAWLRRRCSDARS
jgi:hypothetical protein